MALKGNEHGAAKLFEAFLVDRGEACSWSEGGDPPDLVYDVTSRNERWAVEVTELHQYIETGRGPNSRAEFDTPVSQMCDRLARKVPTTGSLRYVLSIYGPLNTLKTRDIEKLVLERVASGLAGEWPLDSAGQVKLVADVREPGGFGCRFMLQGSTRGPDGRTTSANITENVRFATNRILEAKRSSMSGITSYDRRVLLIWNSYWLASPDSVTYALGQLPVAPFDAIVLTGHESTTVVSDPSRLFS